MASASAATWITEDVQNNVQAASASGLLANCKDIAGGRVSGDQFRFAIREELGFIPALVTASEKRGHLSKASTEFLASQVAALNAGLAAERKKIPALGLPRHVNGYGDLFSLLADQPLVSCKRFK